MGQVCQTATQDDEEYVVVKSKKTVKSKGPNRTEPIRIKPKSAASKRKQYVARNDEDPAVRGNFHKVFCSQQSREFLLATNIN